MAEQSLTQGMLCASTEEI